jgi:hypothetical protein
MRSIMGTTLLALAAGLGLAGTVCAQATGTTTVSGNNTTTTFRPGRMQAPSQPFLNFFPSPTQLFNVFNITRVAPTNTMPASYLQQFGYRVATPAQ